MCVCVCKMYKRTGIKLVLGQQVTDLYIMWNTNMIFIYSHFGLGSIFGWRTIQEMGASQSFWGFKQTVIIAWQYLSRNQTNFQTEECRGGRWGNKDDDREHKTASRNRRTPRLRKAVLLTIPAMKAIRRPCRRQFVSPLQKRWPLSIVSLCFSSSTQK